MRKNRSTSRNSPKPRELILPLATNCTHGSSLLISSFLEKWRSLSKKRIPPVTPAMSSLTLVPNKGSSTAEESRSQETFTQSCLRPQLLQRCFVLTSKAQGYRAHERTTVKNTLKTYFGVSTKVISEQAM